MTRIFRRVMSSMRHSSATARAQGFGGFMKDDTQAPKQGLIRRAWTFLWAPSGRIPFLAILVAGGIGGILFWGGFHWALEVTNTEAFCIGCHEMRDNPYKELQQTIHFRNRSGG